MTMKLMLWAVMVFRTAFVVLSGGVSVMHVVDVWVVLYGSGVSMVVVVVARVG